MNGSIKIRKLYVLLLRLFLQCGRVSPVVRTSARLATYHGPIVFSKYFPQLRF